MLSAQQLYRLNDCQLHILQQAWDSFVSGLDEQERSDPLMSLYRKLTGTSEQQQKAAVGPQYVLLRNMVMQAASFFFPHCDVYKTYLIT